MEYDNRDTCLQYSLHQASLIGQGKEFKGLDFLIKNCRIDTIFHQRKNPTYKWSNSDGLTKFLNTYLGINMYKGLNGDQLRAFYVLLFILNIKYHNEKVMAEMFNENPDAAKKQLNHLKKIAYKHLLGFILRLGFSPSLMENVLFKPQVLVLLLATIWRPLHYIVKPFLLLAIWKERRVPIKKSTTNKISLYPTMALLGMSLPIGPYIHDTYYTYFNNEIAYNMCEWLARYK